MTIKNLIGVFGSIVLVLVAISAIDPSASRAAVAVSIIPTLGDVAYVGSGTTVVDPTTGIGTYSDGMMSGTIRGFAITTMQNFIDNDQRAVINVATNNGGTVTALAYTVSPVVAGTVTVAGIGIATFVPADGFVGQATITVTGLNKKGATITGQIIVDVRAAAAQSLIIDLGAPVDK